MVYDLRARLADELGVRLVAKAAGLDGRDYWAYSHHHASLEARGRGASAGNKPLKRKAWGFVS